MKKKLLKKLKLFIGEKVVCKNEINIVKHKNHPRKEKGFNVLTVKT